MDTTQIAQVLKGTHLEGVNVKAVETWLVEQYGEELDTMSDVQLIHRIMCAAEEVAEDERIDEE